MNKNYELSWEESSISASIKIVYPTLEEAEEVKAQLEEEGTATDIQLTEVRV